MTADMKAILSAVGAVALLSSPALAKPEYHHHRASPSTAIAGVYAANRPFMSPYVPYMAPYAPYMVPYAPYTAPYARYMAPYAPAYGERQFATPYAPTLPQPPHGRSGDFQGAYY